MARYKEYDYSQGKFIPIHFDKQILPGTSNSVESQNVEFKSNWREWRQEGI